VKYHRSTVVFGLSFKAMPAEWALPSRRAVWLAGNPREKEGRFVLKEVIFVQDARRGNSFPRDIEIQRAVPWRPCATELTSVSRGRAFSSQKNSQSRNLPKRRKR
jgi:hypothetical protein